MFPPVKALQYYSEKTLTIKQIANTSAIMPGARNHLLWKIPALVQSTSEAKTEEDMRAG
jgi:hypothetical protein